MDRNKPSSSSRSKQRIGAPHHGSEIFALGSKASTSRDDSKPKVLSGSSSKPSGDRKRESSSSIASIQPKKPKLSSISSTDSTSSNVVEYWEQIAVECESADLVNSVLTSIEQQDSDNVVGLICGAIKSCLAPRATPDSMITISLLYLAKLRPHLFCNETVTNGLVSVLKRDSNHTFKGRSNPNVHILAANLLSRGYQDKDHWPESFLKLYMDDAINERVWIDYPECSLFVENICTAFDTRQPPKSMLQPELNALNPNSRDALGIEEDSGESSFSGDNILCRSTSETTPDVTVQPRYNHLTKVVEHMVLEIIKDQFLRRQAPDCSTRNFLKFLCATCGLCEVRALAVTRLELWIHNGKLMKPAQELLTYLCYNVTGQTPKDHEVLSALVRMRLKTKPLINIYMNCLREMITLQPGILFSLLKFVVHNELSNARNPNNMGLLANMFQTKPTESAKCLAEIYQEFLLQKEDCLRTLRVFLRELVKMLRYDIKLTVFCKSFVTHSRPEIANQTKTSEHRDRIQSSMVDIICLCMLLSVSPQIREASVSLRAGRENKCGKMLLDFYDQMSQIQCDALRWMYNIVPHFFKPNAIDYNQSLQKILMLESPEVYSKGDQWPPEPERTTLLRLVSEVPLQQDSIMCVILIGITKEIPFKIPAAMDNLVQMIRRSAGVKASEFPPLEVNNLEIINFLFSMAEYHHPENIVLPSGYEPPKLAITSLYWQAWSILLMLSAHNPGIFGEFCWEQYPMLRYLIELCITNQFDAKPPEDELQVATLEKSQILEFEKLLAAATTQVAITESNSLLLSQVMLMDPLGQARLPAKDYLERFKALNSSLKLGHLLCRSRKPDYLLDIIQRHGTSQSMPWLADLVQTSEGDFNHLPVQCLCEFLLSNSNYVEVDNNRFLELLAYLQKLLIDESIDHQASCEVLEYFLRRLSSTSKQSRVMAIRALRLLLKIFQEEEKIILDELDSDWLLLHLPQIPHFMYVKLTVIAQLRAACQIENNPELIMIYVQFIAANTQHDPVPEMLVHIYDMSQLIVERTTVFSKIIPTEKDPSEKKIQTLNCLFVMFNNYMIKLRDQKAPYAWQEYADLLLVHLPDGTQLPIHLPIVQAFVILLTNFDMIGNAAPILDYWFPPNVPPPQAFTFETQEQVQILPDWLKLRMIRSNVERLVDAALYDLTPEQLVLFVQNFGTPVSSMSKLLALLDRGVIEHFELIKNSIMNKTYFAQLIDIQQSRGAKNGHIAVQALELREEVVPDQAKSVIPETETITIDLNTPNVSVSIDQIRSREIERVVEGVLVKPVNSSYEVHFRRLIQELTAVNKKAVDGKPTTDARRLIKEKVLYCILHILKRPIGGNVFLIPSSFEICLFRALLACIPEETEQCKLMFEILDLCLRHLQNKPHFLVLYQILFNKRKQLLRTLKIDDPKIPVMSNESFVELLNNGSLVELESNGKRFLAQLMKQKNTSILVDGIFNALTFVKQEDNTKGIEKTGLLVDWLADIDSELVVGNRKQIDLLFGLSQQQFRYYMLSLLSHEASWSTLHQTVNQLLAVFNRNYDPASILHFIEALLRNPKLWQGRDKGTPKHQQVELILNLTQHEAHVLADYILYEIELLKNQENDKVTLRILTFMNCIDIENFSFIQLANFVRTISKADDLSKRKFLQQIYLNYPPIKFMMDDDMSDVFNMPASKLPVCTADVIVNYVVTIISCLSSPKEYHQLFNDMELLVRKLAASHPALLLRQISVLASLLEGRAHMDLNVLRSDFHLPLFVQVITVLDLLQPMIFDDEYKDGLHQALDCYFELLRHHANAKEVYGNNILNKVTDFLQAYVEVKPNRALKYIEPFGELLQDLAASNRNVGSLQHLVQGMGLLKQKSLLALIENQSDVKSTEENLQGAASLILAPYQKSVWAPPSWQQLLNTVMNRQNDDILPALQEIESITARRSGLVDAVYERSLELISDQSKDIRTIAYSLLIRFLKQNPGNPAVNESILPIYIECLCNREQTIALTALDYLNEMTICLQEYAQEILQIVFDLGMDSNVNTFNQLKRTIAALKAQHAC